MRGPAADRLAGPDAYDVAMVAFVGTSGWQYRHWRGRYYPPRLAMNRWLERYAEDFATVELNASFYFLPRRSTFERWAARTPAGFLFAVKASRYLTHVRRLRDPAEPVERLLEAAGGLGDRLGPILLQLPPSLERDVDALAATLDAFPPGVRLAVEPRHDSWFVDEVRDILAARGAALCLADRRGPLGPAWRTADWTYVRFHEGLARPRPCHEPDAITAWGKRLAAGWGTRADVFAYFNNDWAGCAVRDAAIAGAAWQGLGFETSRTPSPAVATVG